MQPFFIRHRWMLLISASLFFMCAGCRTTQGTIRTADLMHDGLERRYHLLIPDNLSRDEPVPLVIALHGGGGTSQSMCRLRGSIVDVAAREGFMVACPQGLERHWNDWRSEETYRAQRDDVDDVGFILGLIGHLSENYPINRERVYITGMSNGGMMTLRMLCESPDTFAAAAAVIASMPVEGAACALPHPVSILFLNGTQDPLIQWEGGNVRIFRREFGETLPVPDVVAAWADANGCAATPDVTWLPDVDASDQTRIWQSTYQGCASGAHVVQYGVEGGGHTWPGGPQYAPPSLIGRTSRDAHAGELIWAFFDASTP